MDTDLSNAQDEQRTQAVGVTRRALLVATVLAVALAALLVGLSTADSSSRGSAEAGTSLADGTSIGSLDAPVTIEMFSEFQCSVCQAFANTNEKLLRTTYVDTGKVRLVYKHFVIFGDESMQAALASEAAAEQNKFWEFYDVVMAARPSAKTEGDLTTADLQMYAEQIGLDTEAFKATALSRSSLSVLMRCLRKALRSEQEAISPRFRIEELTARRGQHERWVSEGRAWRRRVGENWC
jgi:protein-disulfide isomerase